MRAGSLDRTITVERVTEAIDAAGVPRETWSTAFRLRAAVLEANTEEFLRAYGTAAESIVFFRTRFAELRPADRITFDGKTYDVKSVKEIGRRKGLEIRAVARDA